MIMLMADFLRDVHGYKANLSSLKLTTKYSYLTTISTKQVSVAALQTETILEPTDLY